MCGRFIMLSWDDVLDVIKSIELDTPYIIEPDWPARYPSAYPGSVVPIITKDNETLKPKDLRWGFEVDWQKGLVFNTRIETALGPKPGMWKEPVTHGRCIVATGGFFEPHATETVRSSRTGKEIKRQYFFASPDDAPTLLAGVKREGRFSIVTTEPNRWVSPVHKRMPLVLGPDEVRTWLDGDFEALADRGAVCLEVAPYDELALSEGPVQQSLL